QSGDIGQADRANDQRISLPVADRETHRRWIEVVGLAAGHVDDSEPAIPTMNEGQPVLAADDLEWVGHQHDPRHARSRAPGGAIEGGIARFSSSDSFLVYRGGLLRQRRTLPVYRPHLLRHGLRHPNAD